MTAVLPAPFPVPDCGPRLCCVCAFALDPVVAENGVHPGCAEDPGSVDQWRRDGAAWLRRQYARGER